MFRFATLATFIRTQLSGFFSGLKELFTPDTSPTSDETTTLILGAVAGTVLIAGVILSFFPPAGFLQLINPTMLFAAAEKIWSLARKEIE